MTFETLSVQTRQIQLFRGVLWSISETVTEITAKVLNHPVTALKVFRKKFKKRMRTSTLDEQIIHFLSVFRKGFVHQCSAVLASFFQEDDWNIHLAWEVSNQFLLPCDRLSYVTSNSSATVRFSFFQTSRSEDD